AFVFLAASAPLAAQRPDSASHLPPPMTTYPGGAVEWKAGPPTLPAGVRAAVLEGDPAKPGLFTMRLKFPAGTRVYPHFHSETEHATVISGTLHIGMGDRFDSTATKALPAGSYGFWVAGTRHFAWFEGETVLQVQGLGPWTVTYVNPADDPRNHHQ
ncbi:MAG TPA: cupin domain-containing protein, partial [Gemmatimonadales bacterium]